MMRVCGNPIFMLPITVYGRLLGKGGGVSCKERIHKYSVSDDFCPKETVLRENRRHNFALNQTHSSAIHKHSYFNAVKCNLTKLTTRSASLAFSVSGVKICTCVRIPRGVQVVLLSQCSPGVRVSSAGTPIRGCFTSFHCFISVTGRRLLPSARGFMAVLPGFVNH